MTQRSTANARALRRAQTEPEARLWRRLRNRQLEDAKFRRQVPRGPYVADFLCDEAMLIVELDGFQHGFDDNARRDDLRTAYLQGLGYKVLRFTNGEIRRSIDDVLTTIHFDIVARRKAPSSALRAPSPPGEKATACVVFHDAVAANFPLPLGRGWPVIAPR